MISHVCGIKESQIYRHRRMIVAGGQRVWDTQRLVKGYELSIVRCIKS